MALNGEIRQVFADLEDIREWLDADMQPEMDEQRFYAETSVFSKRGEPLGYLCWSRQMELARPGELSVRYDGRMDYGDAARSALEPFIAGLENCTLRLYHGHLLPEAQWRKGFITFELLPPTEAPQVLILIRWPEGEQPGYDKRPDLMGAKMIQRINPSENNYAEGGTGYDVWIVPQEKLGPEFAQRTEEWEAFRHSASQGDWRDFELHRAYYRQKMQTIYDQIHKILDSVQKIDRDNRLELAELFELKMQDDCAVVCLTRSTTNDGGPLAVRCWYNQEGYERLNDLLLQMFAPVGLIASLAQFMS